MSEQGREVGRSETRLFAERDAAAQGQGGGVRRNFFFTIRGMST